jgi:hypothetical protein
VEVAETHNKDHFEKVLARLLEVLVLGKTSMKIGRGILGEIASDQILALVCKVFWGTTITAHLDAAQMAAFKLFDSRSGSMTVNYLLELAIQCSDSSQKKTDSGPRYRRRRSNENPQAHSPEAA